MTETAQSDVVQATPDLKTLHAAVVYNPIKVTLDDVRAAVQEAEREAGWGETRWYETSVDDPGEGVTKQALQEGASGVPIGLLPSGTGNLLARNLDLDLAHMPGSVVSAFTGKDRAIDLGIFEAELPDGKRERRVF